MSETRLEIVTGAAVLAAALGFLFWAGRGAEISAGTGHYPLTASFRSVEGVTVGSDVRMAGVKVGTVTDLELNPQTFFADAEISLRKDVILPDDSVILIASEGLLGGAFVEIIPGGSLTNLEPGEEILDTQGAVSMLALMMKFAGGGSEDGQ
ncbi:outer membrane lipid asymmetry maintenance protein MlaD [Pseudothioclava arenosa]|uniref:Outer membrane lipid asymmetry maintenance protein MlaD n=1 Tax=Pseudothioclava arenosa TaxID=1795308 RepID=A0A2A4CS46_9RHOB|nr:outer membrane lipid asymmetry maintenance protein MlaD [Pseudothioclava arenosa]PCD77150.1 outer membrane lipid asymmetry maintenance protein MlaD [Pseudothioclava arenosa]